MRSVCFYLTVVPMLSFALPSAPPTFDAGTGAKAGLSTARSAAAQWQPDARLVQVSTLSGDDKGTASSWTYLYHSPKAKRAYRLDVSGGKVTRSLEVSAGAITEPIPAAFVDSDEAMTEAKAKGLKTTGRSMLTLHVMLKGTKQEGPYWNIVGDMASGTSSLINATTGKFFRTQPLQ